MQTHDAPVTKHAEPGATQEHRRVPGIPFAGKDDPRRSSGRKPGSRNRLGEDFLKAMADDFEAHGKSAIEKVRTERPQDYLKVVASILPKIINVKTDELEDQSDDELRNAYAREVRKLIAFGVAVGIEIAPGRDEPAGEVKAAAVSALQ